jgi:hypothetical protein
MHASTISCSIVLTSLVRLGLATVVLLHVFWAGLLWGLVVPLSGRRFPILAASIFFWNLAILLDRRGPSGGCGNALSVVSIPVLSSTLGSMAYSRATLGKAAGSWLSLSAILVDCRSIGPCCIGAMLSFPSVLGSRISCSLQSLSTVSSRSCGGTQWSGSLPVCLWPLQFGLLG